MLISSLKLFSFSRYLNFCLDFLVMLKKRLDWKDKLNFNIQTSQPGYDTTYIAQYLLPHIARSKGSQTMKFGQLIEYKKRNIFL